MLLCNKVLFGRKYRALHFYKAELEWELARLMNGYTVLGVVATLLSYFICTFMILTMLAIDQVV